jgi:hypothetical protein
MQDDSEPMIVRTGLPAPYYWLTATCDVYMGVLLRLCPEAVMNR